MKRKFLTILSILTILTVSCEKEEDKSLQSEQGQIALQKRTSKTLEGITLSSNGFLKFQSVSTYEEALINLTSMTNEELDIWEKSLGYQSSYSEYGYDIENPSDVNPLDKNTVIEDPLLKRIINKDGIIQIDNYIFNFRLDEGYVLEMNISNIPFFFDDFKNGHYNSELMNRFGEKDEIYLGNYESVFELLQTNIYGIDTATPNALWRKDIKIKDPIILPNNTTDSEWRVKSKTVFQTAVVYFSLYNENTYQTRIPDPLNITGWHQIDFKMFYANLPGDVVTWWRRGQNSYTTKTGQFPTGIRQGYMDWRPYAGHRGLHDYKFNTTLKYQEITSSPNPNYFSRFIPFYKGM